MYGRRSGMFRTPVENDPSVLVLGAGHVSRAITDLLLFIGCRVTVEMTARICSS